MDVSVIIVNYNTTQLTLQCISSVQRFSGHISYEIIVIDNASTDRTIESIAETFPDVKVIFNSENIGFGRANNQGIEMSKGKYLFLLNSDAYLIDDTLQPFYNFMEKNENSKYGVCGAELSTGTDRATVSFGNFPGLFNIVSDFGFYLLFRKYYLRHLSLGVVNYDQEIKEVDFISGAAMFIRRQAIEDAGMFDKDFFMYFEETEMSWRFHQKGYKSVVLPYVKIIHLEGGSQNYSGFNRFKYQTFASSRQLFYRKCYGKLFSSVAKILHLLHCLVFSVLGREPGPTMEKLKIIYHS